MIFNKLLNRKYVSVILSVTVSFLFVYAFATSTTTISSSGINTTGDFVTTGNLSALNLSVTGTTTLAATTTINGVSYYWPSVDGTSGQLLTTDGNGNLTWTTVSGGSAVFGGGPLSAQYFTATDTNATSTFTDLVTTGNIGLSTTTDPNYVMNMGGNGNIHLYANNSSTYTNIHYDGWYGIDFKDSATDNRLARLSLGGNNTDGGTFDIQTGSSEIYSNPGNSTSLGAMAFNLGSNSFLDGSGQNMGFGFNPDFSALNTAGDGYTALMVNATDANVGATGAKYLMDLQTNGASKFTVDSNGNVFQNGSPFLGSQWSASGSNIYYNTGNVGIGTTSPTEKLVVAGNIAPSINNTYDLGTSTLRFNNLWVDTANIGTSTWSINNGSDGRLSVFDGHQGTGNERLSILTNGNVGIGTSSPDSRLSVVGNVSLQDGEITLSSLIPGYGVTAPELNLSGGYATRDNGGMFEIQDATGTWNGIVPTSSGATIYYASSLPGVVLDCDISTGQKVGGGTCTDNAVPINNLLATASVGNPIELVIDGGAGASTIEIPPTGYVTIRGTGRGTGFYIMSAMSDGIRNSDIGPFAPANITQHDDGRYWPLWVTGTVNTSLGGSAFTYQGLDGEGYYYWSKVISSVTWYVSHDTTNHRWLISNALNGVGTDHVWSAPSANHPGTDGLGGALERPVADSWTPASASGATGSPATEISQHIIGHNIVLKDFDLNMNGVGKVTDFGASPPNLVWPMGINLHGVDGVVLDNMYIVNSPAFSVLLAGDHNVWVHGSTIEQKGGHFHGGNSDGIHLSGGDTNVWIDGITVRGLGDSAIGLNFGEGDASGGGDVFINNFVMIDDWAAIMLYGRVSQPVQPIYISNISDNGVPGGTLYPYSSIGNNSLNNYNVADFGPKVSFFGSINGNSFSYVGANLPPIRLTGSALVNAQFHPSLLDNQADINTFFYCSEHGGGICYKDVQGVVYPPSQETRPTNFIVTSNGQGYFSGNVGIGTTSPYSRLSVAGSVLAESFNATSTGTSTGYMLNGVSVLNNGGIDTNIFIGGGAGYHTTTGGKNVFNGFEAGFNNTLGDYNTLLGYRAGYSATEASDNTFVGYISGLNTTVGSDNVFMGGFSGNQNTAGSLNTFIGAGAGYNNTTGNNDTFLGNSAGNSNVSGDGNTLIGINAGSNNKYGPDLVAIGQDALHDFQVAGGAITAFADYSGNPGVETKITSVGHGLVGGELITINNTTNYNGDWTVANVVDADNFTITAAFVSNDATGYWFRRDRGHDTAVGTRAGVGGPFNGNDTNISFNNSYLGYESGWADAYGNNNLFAGHQAGHNNAAASSSVFLGSNAGYNSMGGSGIVAVGADALYNTQSTNDNIVGLSDYGGGELLIGSGSPHGFSGGEEIFIYGSAGGGSVNGNYIVNTIVDPYSFTITHAPTFCSGACGRYVRTDQGFDTAIGYQAGFNNTTGSNNFFGGYQAGYSNATGSENTFLGYQSGYTNDVGGQNVFIGYHAGYDEVNSNRLYITNENSGPITSSSTALIYGEFDNHMLQINGLLNVSSTTATSTFSGNLHILGDLYAKNTFLGDLNFANAFRFVEDPMPTNGQLATGTQSLILKNQKGENILTIDEFGNLTIPGVINSQSSATSTQPSAISLSIDWILEQFKNIVVTAKEFVADVIRAKKVVTESFEIKDSATGDTYCIKITNGDWEKVKGTCDQPAPVGNTSTTPSPLPTETPATTTISDTSTTTPTDLAAPASDLGTTTTQTSAI